MEDRVTLLLCVLGGSGGFGLIGAGFGALASRSAWHGGHPGGGLVGRFVVDALNRVRDHDLSGQSAAILCGAIDGGVFLGLVGGGVGFWTAVNSSDPVSVLLVAVGVIFLLAAAAVLLGLLGYALVRVPDSRGLGLVGVGGLLGAIAGGRFVGEDGILIGVMIGALAGLVIGNLARRESAPPGDEPSDDFTDQQTP